METKASTVETLSSQQVYRITSNAHFSFLELYKKIARRSIRQKSRFSDANKLLFARARTSSFSFTELEVVASEVGTRGEDEVMRMRMRLPVPVRDR